MKKTTMIILASLMGLSVSSMANEEQAKKLTPLQLKQIAWAMKILGETKALGVSENQCISFDQDILSLLEAEGHIQNGGTQPTTVCFGGGPGVGSATK